MQRAATASRKAGPAGLVAGHATARCSGNSRRTGRRGPLSAEERDEGGPRRFPDCASSSEIGGFGVTLGSAIVKSLRERGTTVLKFHAQWIAAAFADGIQIAALSCPRGSAKTWIAGQLAALSLRPGSPTWQAGIETLAVSASLEQSRVLLNFVRDALADSESDYRWLDSGQRLAVTHKATGTKLRVLSSSGKRAMGLSQFGTIYADEPGSWESRGGALMWDALRGSLGKRPGQRLVLIGTRAPAETASWWPSLLDGGSGPGTHVTVQAAPDDTPWDSWAAIRQANPLVTHNASLRKTILRERDDARRDASQRPAFEAYRLNRMVDVYRDVLVSVEAWKRVEGREVPPREGKPVVGLDLGSERSWSAAWALYQNGRSECYALCPGIPDLQQREKQDAQPRGLYRRLVDDGALLVDKGRRVSRPQVLIDHLVQQGIKPATIFCDRFLLGSLQDAVAGRWPVVARRTRWSEATEDIASFRKLVADGPLSIVPAGRSLARVSLSQASVAADDQGSVRLQKRAHGRSRDDVAVSGVLAAGALVRALERPHQSAWRYRGMAA